MLICNLTKKQYLDPKVFGEQPTLQAIVASWQGSMTALAVLLADGNNRGGGDLHVDHELIGSWAGDAIAILDEIGASRMLDPHGKPIVLAAIAKHWEDLSSRIIDVINQDRPWLGGQIDTTSCVPTLWQRRCLEIVGRVLLSREQMRAPLKGLHELFAIFGQPAAITPGLREQRLQQGVDELAKVLGASPVYKVQGLTLDVSADSTKIEAAHLALQSLWAEGHHDTLDLVFCKPGEFGPFNCSASDVLETFFPVLKTVDKHMASSLAALSAQASRKMPSQGV